MKVSEMVNMITDCDKAIVVDRDTDKVIYDEVHDGGENSCAFLQCKDLEVVGISTNRQNEVNVYVHAPAKRYETFLDVSYTITISADVPFGCDRDEVLRQIAEKKLEAIPKAMTFGDVTWELYDNNMQSGSFYDCIEEV